MKFIPKKPDPIFTVIFPLLRHHNTFIIHNHLVKLTTNPEFIFDYNNIYLT